MKIDVHTIQQQAQEFILRLFVESSGGTTLSDSGSSFYTGAHCGTFTRLRRYVTHNPSESKE